MSTLTGQPYVFKSISQILNILDYKSDDILESIPEREWRLLGVLAKKRKEDEERAKLAVQFTRMWQKEKEERDIVEAETNDQYKQYIIRKRREEQFRQDYKQRQKSLERKQQRRELLDCIKDKEQRAAYQRAWVDDMKMFTMLDKALEEEARALLASERRNRNHEAEEYRRQLQFIDMQQKVENARKKKKAILRDTTQRVAICNAISNWESLRVRREVSACEAARRAEHAAHAALTEARHISIMRAKEAQRTKARKLAVITEHMRQTLLYGSR